MIESLSKIIKISGPGLLFASTAIGVSHLIQSTRAGADFGLMIIGFVVLVSVLKYPFFEFLKINCSIFCSIVKDGPVFRNFLNGFLSDMLGSLFSCILPNPLH